MSDSKAAIATDRKTDRTAVFLVIAGGSAADKEARVVSLDLDAAGCALRAATVDELLLCIASAVKVHLPLAPAAAASGPDVSVAPRRQVLGPLTIDRDEHQVYIRGARVHLRPMELRLLAYLAEHRGRLCSREELLKEVWGHKRNLATRTLDTHAKRLRDKLGPAGAVLETVRGVGFRLLSWAPPHPIAPPRGLPGDPEADVVAQRPVSSRDDGAVLCI